MVAFVEVPLSSGQAYRSIEIQQIELGETVGLLAATHRPTGELDVHLSPELSSSETQFDESWFRHDPFLSHMSFGSVGPAEFRVHSFDVDPRRVDVDVEFVDKSSSTVRVEMVHRFVRRPSAWFVPAVRQDQPTTLRFMSADYIRLMPRWAGRLNVSVDGTRLTPRSFLLPKRLAPYHLARFSGGVFGVGLNEPASRPDEPMDEPTDEITVTDGGRFFTAILRGWSDGARAGDFLVDSPMGTVATGRWRATAGHTPAEIELDDVAQHWFPGWRHPTRLALYGLRRLKRKGEGWRWEPGEDSTFGRWVVSRRVG